MSKLGASPLLDIQYCKVCEKDQEHAIYGIGNEQCLVCRSNKNLAIKVSFSLALNEEEFKRLFPHLKYE